MQSIRLNKGPSMKRGIGQGFCLTLICLFVLLSFTFLLVSPVLAQPVITTPPLLPQGQTGSFYYTALQAAGGTPPYTWSIITGGLPTGLNLAATGIISGTPTIAGTFNFSAQVTDSAAATATQPFILTVNQPPLKFLTTSLRMAKEGEGYSDKITVSGGTTPYTWSITSGSLPIGLALQAGTGYISGAPAKGTVGSYSFIITVTDSSATPITGQQGFSIIVEKGGYEAIITIGNGLKAGETKVYVSGSPMATLRGGESTKLSLDVGVSRSVSVDEIVQHPTDSGVRFKAELDRITVSDTSPDITFPYYAEYSIELKPEPSKVGQISGTGWYKEDYTLRVSAPDEVNDPNTPNTQYRFAYWKLPTGETVSGRELSLTVNAAGTC
ncbi:MAG: putative Ig domain-containing protein, partial [Chloroflexi bacterium]|nr:putative Ig domain-containing protein [Chloroflexota bacterium]